MVFYHFRTCHRIRACAASGGGGGGGGAAAASASFHPLPPPPPPSAVFTELLLSRLSESWVQRDLLLPPARTSQVCSLRALPFTVTKVQILTLGA